MNNMMTDTCYVIIRIHDKPHNGINKYKLGNNENTSTIIRMKFVHLMKDSMVLTSAKMGRQTFTRLNRIRHFSGNSDYIFGF